MELVTLNCGFCNKVFIRRASSLKARLGVYYCSIACKNDAVTKKQSFCLNCDVSLKGKNGKKFCSHKCQQESQRKLLIERWKNNLHNGLDGPNSENIAAWIRNYIIDRDGNKCSKCNWNEINPVTGRVPIQIDHIDGNFRNNIEENLRLLCPNCHSLTPTFGALNIGRGGRKLGRIKQMGI